MTRAEAAPCRPAPGSSFWNHFFLFIGQWSLEPVDARPPGARHSNRLRHVSLCAGAACGVQDGLFLQAPRPPVAQNLHFCSTSSVRIIDAQYPPLLKATRRRDMAKTSESKRTDDHETIRKWAEERDARPSRVKSTASDGDTGILRMDFPGYSGADELEEISWDEFFDKFDQENLEFLYQEQTEKGEISRFNKFVNRQS
jgi:hypothetical protein